METVTMTKTGWLCEDGAGKAIAIGSDTYGFETNMTVRLAKLKRNSTTWHKVRVTITVEDA